MKAGKSFIIVLVVLVVFIVIVFLGYSIYRYPAKFRNLSDNSLKEEEVKEVRSEILKKEDVKILVAYFSNSGTTERMASEISTELNADLFEIKPKEAYSNIYTQGNNEIRNSARPELAETVDNMDEYDVVFVGFPVWWHATPAVINTFLESHDLSGKLIIPFGTSGGSDIDEPMPTFLDSCDGLAVFGEKRITGTGEITGWLEELELQSATAQ